MISRILLTMCIVFSSLSAKITETNEIQTILPYIKQDSLVFFNLSDVLFEHTTYVAEGQFRDYFQARAAVLIEDAEQRAKLVNRVRNLLVTKLPKQNVEEVTASLVENLQKRKIPVLGITQKMLSTPYASNFGELTHQALIDRGIDLAKTLDYLSLPVEQVTADYTFKWGVLFTEHHPIHSSLTAFLHHNSYTPAEIIMIDNDLECLESAQAAAQALEVPFQGIQYTKGDERKAQFNLKAAILQFFFLLDGHILPNEYALLLTSSSTDEEFKTLLDGFITSEYAQNLLN